MSKGITITTRRSERLRLVLAQLVEVEPERRTQSASQLQEELTWVEKDPSWCRGARSVA